LRPSHSCFVSLLSVLARSPCPFSVPAFRARFRCSCTCTFALAVCLQVAVYDKDDKTWQRREDAETVEKLQAFLRPLEGFCAYLMMKACKARMKQLGV
jgi:hypothetical protein